MRPWRTANLLLLGGVVVLAVLLGLGAMRGRPGRYEYFPDMARSARYNAFSPNPNFPDGKTLQPAVAGTIAVERAPGSAMSPALADMAPRPGTDMANPFAEGDAKALARGRAAFTTFCQPCHGGTGKGDGTVVARGYPRPPDIATGGATTSSDAEIFQTISLGAPEMPPYAAQVSPADRWRIVLYLRTLQGLGVAPAAASRGAQ
jgi:mono/diheme cytochrome c family protein